MRLVAPAPLAEAIVALGANKGQDPEAILAIWVSKQWRQEWVGTIMDVGGVWVYVRG